MNSRNSSTTLLRRTSQWCKAAFLGAAAVLGLNAQAQLPNSYSFAASSAAYSPLVGGTNSTAAGDDGTQTNIPIGFNFTYNATVMTAFGISTNGNIRLGTSAATTGPAGFTNSIGAATTNTIAAMWDDDHRSAGTITYLTTGAPGSQVLTVCWTNTSIGGGGSTGNSTNNYKIELFETTNVIQISYGALTAANGLSASIGITGASGNYISVTPAATPTTSTVTPNNSISAVTFLPTGTVYTFTPPVACMGTPAGGTATPATPVVCNSGTSVISLSGHTTGLNITFAWEESDDNNVGDPWAPVVGGSGATTASYTTATLTATRYYRCIVTCTSVGGGSAPSTTATVTVNPNPTVGVGAVPPGPFCGAANAVLTGTGATTYTWAPATGLSATNTNPVTATHTATTTYTVTGTLAGCTATATVTVTVNPNPVISSVTATPPAICFNASSQLQVNATVAPPYAASVCGTSFLDISAGLGTSVGSAADDSEHNITMPSFTFNGVAYTTARVGNNGAMVFGSAAGEIGFTNTALPNVAGFGTAGTIGLAPWWDDLTPVAAATTIFTYDDGAQFYYIQWNNEDHFAAAGTGSVTFQVVLDYTSGEIYYVYNDVEFAPAAAQNGGGSATVGLSFSGTSALQYSFNQQVLTLGQCILFTPVAPTYSWALSGNLDNAGIANPLAGPLAASETFTVTVTNPATSCSNTGTVTVTVSAPITTATITPATPAFCTGGSVLLTATPDNGGGPFTYQWTDPNNALAGTNNTQSANIAGIWAVNVSDACGGMAIQIVTVVENALPTVSISPVPANALICGGVGNVVMTAGGAVTYSWSPTSGLSPTTGSPVTATPASTTTYTVTGTDANGCVNTATQTVSVGANPVVSLVTATPAAICDGDNSALAATAFVPGYTAGVCGNSFFDISGVGTSVGTAADDSEHNITMPSFTFNGVAYTTARVGNNGAMVFGSAAGEIGFTNTTLPNAGGFGSAGSIGLAPWWEDLLPSVPATAIFTYDDGSQFFYIQWHLQDAFGAAGTGTVTFQVQLDYTTGEIFFVYDDVTFDIASTQNGAGSGTVGLSFGPTSALQYSFNTQVLTAGQCIVFTPNTPSSYSWAPAGFLDNANAQNPNASAVTPLPQTFTVTATSALGCTGTGTVTITEDLTDTDGDLITDCNDNCPNLAGQIGDFCDADAGPAFLFGQIDGTCTCVAVPCTENVTLELRTDANSDQASWEILLQNSAQVVCQGGGYPPNIITPITETCCLPVGCFRLRVLDSGGDGFVTGGYQLRETGVSGRRIIDNFGNFLSGSTSAIANTLDNGAFCVPISNDKPIFSSCDKLDWVNYQFIVATENLAVTAQYNPTAPIASQPTNLNSGYEFWFYNPNGGYSYRRFRNHATSDGFGSGATRACHFKINKLVPVPPGNQNTNLEIPYNTLLNVRIRARVNGVNQPFGAACQFKMDAARAFCPLAKLQDNPLNVTDYSCGVFKNFGGPNSPSNRITANPPQFAPAATAGTVRYQFRFRIPGENICIVRPAQTSATLVMNWAGADSLECGKTYLVEVRVSRTSGATWCVDSPTPACHPNPVTIWGKICNVTINPCFQGGGGGNSLAVETSSALTMYPNPNQGDQLFFSLSGVETGIGTVSVDIFDMAGKRVSARTLAVQDGNVNTTMELNGELAGGMYVVNITAGDKTYTERLVIQP